MDKQGQGLSLNVIIIAAIALVVMVVLITIFIGKTGDFAGKVGEEANSELLGMKPIYGTCHPSATSEIGFKAEYVQAGLLDNEQEQMIKKAESKSSFKQEIERCRNIDEKTSCEEECSWS